MEFPNDEEGDAFGDGTGSGWQVTLIKTLALLLTDHIKLHGDPSRTDDYNHLSDDAESEMLIHRLTTIPPSI